MFADDLTAAGEGTVASGKFWLGEVQRDVVKGAVGAGNLAGDGVFVCDFCARDFSLLVIFKAAPQRFVAGLGENANGGSSFRVFVIIL